MPNTADFLFEIGTEELPPQALERLGESFHTQVVNGLSEAKLSHGDTQWFAAPRRLAILIRDLVGSQEDSDVEKRGPPVKAAFDKDGNPTKAALGFAKTCGIDISKAEKRETEKGAWLFYQYHQKGKSVRELMPEIVTDALKNLPVPKMMRWGSSSIEFVRPVHWATMLYGSDIIETTILGVKTTNQTRGHRFHHPKPIALKKAVDYETTLEKKGFVIPDFHKRQKKIHDGAIKAAATKKGTPVITDALLSEVTGLVEWPVSLIASFNKAFLAIPHEGLTYAMESHQKCFPIIDGDNNMLPFFIATSNLESLDPTIVVKGNEKVMTARLSDATFFYETDCKTPLANHTKKLSDILFQKKLGSLGDKSNRVATLSIMLSTELNVNSKLAKRAAELSKCDLLTYMVGEFPDLQGTMGYYYAKHDGENDAVAIALKEQYLPRFSGDVLPQTKLGATLAVADRVDTLVGLFGINQPPTGDKDPFALRRAAAGVLRTLIENQYDIDLVDLISESISIYGNLLTNEHVLEDLILFFFERMRAYYMTHDYTASVLSAVVARRPTRPVDFHRRIEAVQQFLTLPEAASLAAANKRVSNILLKETKKQKGEGKVTRETAKDLPSEKVIAVDKSLLEHPAEKTLSEALDQKAKEITPLHDAGNYTAELTALATLQKPIDQFFDEVMVMVDDPKVRGNRLALLTQLRELFLQVADISLIQTKDAGQLKSASH